MKIFIQGRKDGYNVLYPTPTPSEFYQFACDIQRIDAENNALYYGQSLYSIAFTNGGCIFTKYVMGYDVQRSNLGSIGISFYIPNTKKMKGADVKTLLDELVKTYCKNYCPDFHINSNKQENWQLFTKLAEDYDDKLRTVSADDAESLQSGTQEAAFIYYTTGEELQKYFDAPYQDEYRPFKQVFFVNRSENPLNALRHSKELKDIDLSKYKLIYYSNQDGINITVEVRGNIKRNKEKISREKDELNIIYSKEYYKNKIVTGKLYEIDKQFIQIDEINRKVTVNHFNGLTPETKLVRFDIRDKADRTINNVKISCPTKNPTLNEIMFNGNEIGINWQIKIDAGDRYKLQEISIIPKDVSGTYPITLEEQKIVVFQAIDSDNGDVIPKFILEIGGHKKQNNQIYFYGNDIRKTCCIRIMADGYSSKERIIIPHNETHPVVFDLKKKPVYGMRGNHPKQEEEKRYYLEIDEKFGKRSYNGCLIYEYEHNYPSFKCDTQFGYKFETWEKIDKKYKDYDGYFKAKFKELWYHKIPMWAWIVTSSAVIVAIIVVGCLIFRGNGVPTKEVTTPVAEEIIVEYLNDDSLIPANLKEYKKKWEGQKPPKISKSNSIWYNLLSWWFSNEEVIDSIKQRKHDEIAQKIDDAIKIRTFIKDGNIYSLKEEKYSNEQETFERVIKSIDSTAVGEISKKMQEMPGIENATLNVIADSIKSWVKIYNIENKTSSQGQGQMPAGKKENAKKESAAPKAQKPPTQKQNSPETLPAAGSSNVSKSDLGKDFFDLIQKGYNQKDAYTSLYNKHKSEKGEIVNFLKEITKGSKEFDEFKNKFDSIPATDKRGIKSLTQLKEKIK
jgi:hypothetical protein